MIRPLLLTLALALPVAAQAQAPSGLTLHPELRVDGIFRGDTSSVESGGGVQVPAGYYARIGVIAAAGAQFARGGPTVATGRVDIIGRFLLDPFRQQRNALSVGGGVSLRAREHDHVRPYLVALIDLEGPMTSHGYSPALQVGLGGGVRVGGVLRWGGPKAR